MWTLLKEFTFEDRTVRLLRSNVSLRFWRDEVEFNCEEKLVYETDDEHAAWLGFLDDCRAALNAMEMRHCKQEEV